MLEDYGNPKCPVCTGRGRLPVEGSIPPALRLCRCVLHREILANVERGMRGLSKAAKVQRSPLTSLKGSNAWITADVNWFQAHLRHVAVRQSPRWEFRVCTDADLIVAWLATAALGGHKIHDVDAAEALDRPSLDFLTLADIAYPSTLLIIRLGVKTAPNKEMSNVLIETLRIRAHEDKPTWVWDQSSDPLNEGHRAWSPTVMEEMSSWTRVREGDEEKYAPMEGKKRKVATPVESRPEGEVTASNWLTPMRSKIK